MKNTVESSLEKSDFKIVPLRYKRLNSSLDKIGEVADLNLEFSLSELLNYFRVDLMQFLLNDCYYLEVDDKDFKVNNDKFIKKHAVREDSSYVKLW